MAERWWCIAESEIVRALRQVENGDQPAVVMMELLANTETEDHRG